MNHTFQKSKKSPREKNWGCQPLLGGEKKGFVAEARVVGHALITGLPFEGETAKNKEWKPPL